MNYLCHENVMSIYGICFSGDKIFLITPLMKEDLRNYIEKNPQIDYKQLIVFALEIASGMEYLSLNKYIHRDLAARNILLDFNLCPKIADFGLTRDASEKEYTTMIMDEEIPIRWVAIEVFRTNKFTTQSDIWSFGVLLWELFTRGGKPYSHMSKTSLSSESLIYYLNNGMRLHQPDGCDDKIYKLMLKCWNFNPDDRPSFTEIISFLIDVQLNYSGIFY